VAVAATLREALCPDARIEVARVDGGVLVETHFAGSSATHTCSMPGGIDVKVPRRFDVRIRSSGGGISVSGVEGDVTGRTNGGALELSRLKGHVDLVTNGGRIDVTDSDLEGRVHTNGGPVRFENVSGGVRGSSNGGTVVRRGGGARGAAGGGDHGGVF
jgi:hypothetical protein